ncbi:hypothetical protein ILUMI_27222 [Ignelater luminosus]|uniref:C2H2-type domain-containing protein n=1 Tax=Ignelater luminosus TaxID=2038154 RepID=A0A8K0C3P9_IGNLU|nr:hypothetical protein ILUMI_27222 [Ignelater luminosus]
MEIWVNAFEVLVGDLDGADGNVGCEGALSDMDDKSIFNNSILHSSISIKLEPKSPPPPEDLNSDIPKHQLLYGVEDYLNLLKIQEPRKKRSTRKKLEENLQKQPKRNYVRKERTAKSNVKRKKLVKEDPKEEISEPTVPKFETLDKVGNHKEMRNTLIGIDQSNIIKDVVRRTDILAKRRKAAAIEKRRRDWEAKNMKELMKKESSKKKPATKLRIYCSVCNAMYSKNISLALHSVNHNTEGKYSCHLCPYTTGAKTQVVKHIRAHEDKTKSKCEICNWAFTVASDAAEHKYFHTGEKPFQCELCGKHFMFSKLLNSHRRTRHWEEITGTPLVKYDCTICNLHYNSHSGLKRHQLRHHRQAGKPINTSVKCNMCEKVLSSKDKLKFHQRTHTGYKPHECVVCSKRFIRKEQLKEHERVHTGERPFACEHCGKAFTQRSPLKIHVRTHTGEKPYICDLCNKGFISKSMRDTHMKRCQEKYST